ncbi:MAG: restriction endonuclease subunit S [Thermoguttaceae bacterium]|nr:restriction endonuclease subunit S [Thermoguttaceae bacterium]
MIADKLCLGSIIEIKKGSYITKKDAKEGPYPVILGGQEPAYYIDRYNHTGRAIVISRSGASAGYVSRWNEPIFITDGFLIEPKEKVVFDFLYYLLKYHQPQLQGLQGGAAIPHVNPRIINAIEVLCPATDVQSSIADILSSYDNLIENNQKQIKLLEEAAQRLYKEWFVDFRFPGYENTPIVDGVPEGWKTVNIESLCKRINAGGTPSRSNKNYWSNPTVKWFKTGELQDCWLFDSDEMISQEGLNCSSAKIFPQNTILMAIYASPTLGRLGILNSDASCNQAALCLLADETKVSWQWLYSKLYELRDDFNAVAKGAGQQNISAEIVKKKDVLLPNKELVDAFSNQIAPLFDRCRLLQKQVGLLSQARDRLLPKLMNGEIDV